jgi:2-amino-4-hydroxy-6-hydroxymethyldihydropteridine diphosphokinase
MAPERAKAIVAFGSNLGDREAMIVRAISEIEAGIGPSLGRSGLIETEAWIHPDDDADWHPPFLNGVGVFETTLEARSVLMRLLAIEEKLGRERGPGAKPWQPRPIDLDLIALGDRIIDEPDLILPHPRMQERHFVLEPLAELLPDWRHPVLGRTVSEMLAAPPD